MAIVSKYLLRSAKGAPLTNNEVDGTFQSLKDDIGNVVTQVAAQNFTTSAELAVLISNETGCASGLGLAVFNLNPSIQDSIITGNTTFSLINTVATTVNFAGAATVLNVGALGCITTLKGTLDVTGDVVAFSTSDIRLKNNVKHIGNALAKVKALNGVTWDWKDDVAEGIKKTPTTGLIAQEVEQVLPQVVIDREDGTKAVNYEHIIGLLVEAIKELNAKVESLSA